MSEIEIRPSVHVYRYVGKSIKFVCLSPCLSVGLSVCFFSIHLSLCVCMLSYLSACLSLGLFVCKSAQLSNGRSTFPSVSRSISLPSE